MHAVDYDVDADVEFASDVVGDYACSVVTHVVWLRAVDVVDDVHVSAVDDLAAI